ncbi:MAG: TRL-like family protein [Planctomycetes bacterium]|nr:TRL-like family protein [Planctomycetota bacterium]
MLRGLLLVIVLALNSGCVFVNIETPLDIDLAQTKFGTKQGEANLQSVLWLVAWGDAGTRAAADNGKLTTVNHADQRILSVLGGLYYRHSTIVYGD